VDVPPQPTAAIADVLAGTIERRITYMLAPISITLTPIRDGKLLPLGVSTERRSILLPNVPTIAEAGVAGFDFPIWYGIWIPAGTATGVAGKLAEDIARVLAGPDLRDWIVEHGGEPMSMAQPEFARFVQSESASAARLIKAAAVERQ
jgi:tripartite-type tricarboxylate transporter receptor subunit TctC